MSLPSSSVAVHAVSSRKLHSRLNLVTMSLLNVLCMDLLRLRDQNQEMQHKTGERVGESLLLVNSSGQQTLADSLTISPLDFCVSSTDSDEQKETTRSLGFTQNRFFSKSFMHYH